MSSYWVIMSFGVKGETFWWYSAVMEISMLNALMRYLERFPDRAHLTEYSPEHWVYVDHENRRGTIVQFVVRKQIEMPVLVNEKKTTIYDWRDKDKVAEAKRKEEESKSKLKPVPLTINFKLK